MAQRPIWRGHLRLALVSCPVALYSAQHDRNTIRFNMINPATGNRIRMVSVDAETGDPVERGQTVKGYQFKKDHYLIVTEEDLASVKVESSSVMTVDKFVAANSIDPVYFDASYYVAPDGEAGKDVYAVLREAITRTGRIALSRVVIGQRERTVALRPADGGLVAHTLHDDRDLNSAKPLFEEAGEIKTDPEMVQLAVQLIDRQTGQYDPSDVEDRYETRLRAMLDAKLQGEGLATEDTTEPDRSNVIDLMSALKKSLQASAEPPSSAPPAQGQRPAESAPATKEKQKPKAAAQAAAKSPRKRA
jgi:DNA end-binding protein Ku